MLKVFIGSELSAVGRCARVHLWKKAGTHTTPSHGHKKISKQLSLHILVDFLPLLNMLM